MELTRGSETLANYNLTPGKYPKEYIQYSNHGESLKSRISELHENQRREGRKLVTFCACTEQQLGVSQTNGCAVGSAGLSSGRRDGTQQVAMLLAV